MLESCPARVVGGQFKPHFWPRGDIETEKMDVARERVTYAFTRDSALLPTVLLHSNAMVLNQYVCVEFVYAMPYGSVQYEL